MRTYLVTSRTVSWVITEGDHQRCHDEKGCMCMNEWYQKMRHHFTNREQQANKGKMRVGTYVPFLLGYAVYLIPPVYVGEGTWLFAMILLLVGNMGLKDCFACIRLGTKVWRRKKRCIDRRRGCLESLFWLCWELLD